MSTSIQLMDSKQLEFNIKSLATQIAVDFKGTKVTLMGMATRGIPLSLRLKAFLEDLDVQVSLGTLDATFFRDDYHFRAKFKNPKLAITQLSVLNLDDENVIIVDDVLYTGRSVRSSLEAIFQMGRPRSVQLCVLVDRQSLEMPIFAKYVGLNAKTDENEEIKVSLIEVDEIDDVSKFKIGN